MIEVEIDKGSGFCFGVVTAIESAERELKNTDRLYCLGDIVHNRVYPPERRKGLAPGAWRTAVDLRDCPAERYNDRGCDLSGGASVAT